MLEIATVIDCVLSMRHAFHCDGLGTFGDPSGVCFKQCVGSACKQYGARNEALHLCLTYFEIFIIIIVCGKDREVLQIYRCLS